MNDPNYVYLTSKADRDRRVRRRKRLADAGLCITTGSHGPATHGRLCAACRRVHKGLPREETISVAA
jgi:hypothetical protein